MAKINSTLILVYMEKNKFVIVYCVAYFIETYKKIIEKVIVSKSCVVEL